MRACHFLIGLVVTTGCLLSTAICGTKHQQWVHQYVVTEAYGVLRNHFQQDIPEMLLHLGTTEQGDYVFNPGGLIAIGAYREDCEDMVYWYGVVPEWTATVTHFWDPDDGDGSKFQAYPTGVVYENAFVKASQMIYGGYELRVPYPANQIIEAYEAPAYLPTFYQTRQIFYKGFYDIQGEFTARNYWTTVSEGFRDKIVWEILGRVCHLLTDVSVPAHAHYDQHDGVFSSLDVYEEAMGSQFTTWNQTHALAAGGMIDVTSMTNPLKYLFYTSAQLAGHFASNGVPGNNGYGVNEPLSNYPPLEDMIAALGPPDPPPPEHWLPPFPPIPVDVEEVGSTSFVYSIRAVAGLLHWFAVEAGLWPPPNMLLVPWQYPTLASALSAATAGKTVFVTGSQTVNTYLNVNTGVTLELAPGSSLVFSSSSTRLLVYGTLNINGSSSSHVTIDGQGYSRSGYLYPLILVASGGTASIQYADFQNAPFLLTAYTNAGNVTAQNCSFTNFGTTADAKAIAAASIAGTMTIVSNSITGSNQGIGIYSSSNGTKVSINGNTITNCGTGIRAYSSNASITDNIIRNNVNYGILADNVTYSAEYGGNDLRGNGYGLFLNSASPMVHHNTIIQNGCNVYMSSSSPVFGEPSEIHGHNVIAMAASPLVSAQNSSSPCLGYGQGTGGQNSLYETDYPHAYAQNYSIVYAQYNYWDGGVGSCYTDGTSQFLGEYPLANDPNPYPQLKVAIAQTGSGLIPEIGLVTTDEEQFKETLLRAIAAGHSGNLSQAKDSLAWLITNKSTSAYAPLALLAYGDFSGLKGDVLDVNKSVMLESDFQARLVTLKDLPQANPLRPFAVRFLARGAMLAHDVKTASAYSEQLVKEYPGTVHELVSLYDLLVTAIEIDEDHARAHTYLEVLKKKYPDNDLTISASILCGEKVLPGPKKEPEATQTAVLKNGLNAAYPNPFNPTTSVVFSLKQDANVRLTVFDILGREVATLADGMRAAGKHSVVWNARSVTSGVYFARLEINDEAGNLLYRNTAKLLLTK